MKKITKDGRSFADLVRDGVIDRKKLPHPLSKKERAEVARRMAVVKDELQKRASEEIPF